jgi:hypothetical protein
MSGTAKQPPGFGPWARGLTTSERLARWRGLRALALVYVGGAHPLVSTLRAAERDRKAAALALEQLDALPALRRRRLLASYGALDAPPRQRQQRHGVPSKERQPIRGEP